MACNDAAPSAHSPAISKSGSGPSSDVRLRRASGSSSTISVRIFMGVSSGSRRFAADAIRQRYAYGGTAARRSLDREGLSAAVKLLQALACIGDTDAGFAVRRQART